MRGNFLYPAGFRQRLPHRYLGHRIWPAASDSCCARTARPECDGAYSRLVWQLCGNVLCGSSGMGAGWGTLVCDVFIYNEKEDMIFLRFPFLRSYVILYLSMQKV